MIYNRLKARMPLGIDATIRYGLNIPPTESLHESQLHRTRTRTTRASTPACRRRRSRTRASPSIQAAAHPRQTPYLYFVRKPDKMHHAFFTNQHDFDNYKPRTATGREHRPPHRRMAMSARDTSLRDDPLGAHGLLPAMSVSGKSARVCAGSVTNARR